MVDGLRNANYVLTSNSRLCSTHISNFDSAEQTEEFSVWTAPIVQVSFLYNGGYEDGAVQVSGCCGDVIEGEGRRQQ